MSQLPHQAGAYPGFCSMKWLGVFLLPLDGMLVLRRVTPSIKFTGTHFLHLGRERHPRVKCLAQEHNTMSPARAQTQSTCSGVKCTNHEATAAPTEKTYSGLYISFSIAGVLWKVDSSGCGGPIVSRGVRGHAPLENFLETGMLETGMLENAFPGNLGHETQTFQDWIKHQLTQAHYLSYNLIFYMEKNNNKISICQKEVRIMDQINLHR